MPNLQRLIITVILSASEESLIISLTFFKNQQSEMFRFAQHDKKVRSSLRLNVWLGKLMF